MKTWFLQDDFVWLGLHNQIHNWRDLLHAIFVPTVHGTLRPLSERGFFLAFYSIFGLEALPFHACMLVTQMANLILLGSIVCRLCGSRLAGFLAPIFWIVNSSLCHTLSWSSAYMQVLCGFFLLVAFHFLLRYIETGERRYYVWQWLAFLSGFAAMETNLVYPALASIYTLLFARKYFRRVAPKFVPSILFVIVHMLVAPKQSSGPYSIHIDTALPKTLWTYWTWALIPDHLGWIIHLRRWMMPAASALLTIVLAGFAIQQAKRKQFLPVMFFCWFVILIAPVLPLREHLTDYYLTLPLIGLAALGAYAFACAWRGSAASKLAATLLAGAYVAAALPAGHAISKWWYDRGNEVRTLVLGVARARELHPGKIILLTGVGNDLFWAGVADHSFRAIGVEDVYLAPGSEAGIDPHPEFGSKISDYILPAGLTLRGLDHDQIVVYSVRPERLKNVTREYARLAAKKLEATEPSLVDVANPMVEYLLGPTWYPREGPFRWMPKRATLRIGGPRSTAEKLHISGYCAAVQTPDGPLRVTVALDGKPFPAVAIPKCGSKFQFDFQPPAEAVGKPSVELAIEVDRTFAAADGRQVGLVFGVFEFSP